MRIQAGNIYAVIGKNGCGKTTLMNKIYQQNYNKKMIYIKQNDCLIEQYNIEDNLKFMNYDFKDNQINEILELDKIRKLYPSQVSLGQRQMTSVICALYGHFEWILFDETFSGINQKHIYFLLDLCKRNAVEHNKVILIVTHQNEVIDYCDQIISFDDGVPELEYDKIQDKTKNHVSFKEILVYQEKNWLKHLMIFMIIAVCFLFVSLTLYYRSQIYASVNSRISDNVSTEAFILNNTDIYHPYYGDFDIYYSSIETNQLHQMENIVGLKNFKAYIPFSLEMKSTESHETYYEPISLIIDDKKEEVGLDINNQYFIDPYTSYSKMNESINYQTSHEDGIILTEWFCEQVNINYADLEKLQIQMNVSIPVSQTETDDGMQTTVSDDTGKDVWKNVKGRIIEYKEETLTFFVKGILDNDGPFQAHNSFFALLDHDQMQSLFTKNNINYNPNAFFAEIEDVSQYKRIQNEVESISPTLEFYTVYNLYQISEVTENFIQMLSLISLIPLSLFLIITMYMIFIQKKTRLYNYEKLLLYGYHIKSCLVWMFKKYFIDILLFLFIYFILFQFCNYFLNDMHYPLIEIRIGDLILPILLVWLIPLGVDIFAFYKKYRYIME